jgi:hypothetical protein
LLLVLVELSLVKSLGRVNLGMPNSMYTLSMNVEIGTEAPQFPEKEYINHKWDFCCSVDSIEIRGTIERFQKKVAF